MGATIRHSTRAPGQAQGPGVAAGPLPACLAIDRSAKGLELEAETDVGAVELNEIGALFLFGAVLAGPAGIEEDRASDDPVDADLVLEQVVADPNEVGPVLMASLVYVPLKFG